MSGHITIVVTDADQPYHAHLVAGNNQTTWVNENHRDETDAFRAVRELGEFFSPVDRATVYPNSLHVWLDADELGEKYSIPIGVIDRRTQAAGS